jgi:outer membrane lipoprotein-sorting protein
MYVRAVGCALVIASMASPVPLAQSPPTVPQSPTVDEIVARNLAARGGADKLRAVTSVKMTGRVKGPGGEYPVVSWAKRPNKMRRERISEGQTFVLGFDGMTVWQINPLVSPKPREIAGPQADRTRQDAGAFDTPLLDYKAKGTTVELVGTEPVQGITMHRLRVTWKNGSIQEIYLNVETMLEAKIVMQMEQGGRKALVTSEFYNYKEVNGVTMPFGIRQSFNGQVMAEVIYDQVEFDAPMADALFAMPK